MLCKIARQAALEIDGVAGVEQAGNSVRSVVASRIQKPVTVVLVDGVAEAVAQSNALRIYIANIMTQEGETEGYTLSDHLKALFAHSKPGLVDLCLANSTAISQDLQNRYRVENAAPILIDRAAVEALGVELTCCPLANEGAHQERARHDPVKLARAVMDLIEYYCVRTWTDSGIRYIRET